MIFNCLVLLFAAVLPVVSGVRLKAIAKSRHRRQQQALAKTQAHLRQLYPAWDWNASSTSSLLQYVRADIIADAAMNQATESTHLAATFQQSGGVPTDHGALFLDNGLLPSTRSMQPRIKMAQRHKKLPKRGRSSASMIQLTHGDPIDIVDEVKARMDKLVELESTVGNRTINMWPDGVVFIKFDDEINDKTRSILLRAVFEFERTTCIRFVDITSDGCPEDLPSAQARACSYPVIVVKGDVCSGNIGYLGTQTTAKGPGQLLTLADGCEFYGVILHEIGHIVGIDHEQNRWDRDDHVSIHVENIMDDRYLIAFARVPWSGMPPAHKEIPYDLHSVMHYEPCAFGNTMPGFMNNYQCESRTLSVLHPETLRPNEVVGQRIRLSVMDVVKFNKMYHCEHATPWGAGVTEDNAFPSMVTWGASSTLAWPGDRIDFLRQRVQRGVPFYQDASGRSRWLVLSKRLGWRLCDSPNCNKLLYRPNTDDHLDIEANPVLTSLASWSGPHGRIDDVIVRGGPTAVWVQVSKEFEGFTDEEWRGYYWKFASPDKPRPDYFHMHCILGQCQKLAHSIQWLPTTGTHLSDAGPSVWSFVRGTDVIATIESNAWSPTDVHNDVTNHHSGKAWQKVGNPSVKTAVKIEYSAMVSYLDNLD